MYNVCVAEHTVFILYYVRNISIVFNDTNKSNIYMNEFDDLKDVKNEFLKRKLTTFTDK